MGIQNIAHRSKAFYVEKAVVLDAKWHDFSYTKNGQELEGRTFRFTIERLNEDGSTFPWNVDISKADAADIADDVLDILKTAKAGEKLLFTGGANARGYGYYDDIDFDDGKK